jgi:cytochrome c oxidase subunit 1
MTAATERPPTTTIFRRPKSTSGLWGWITTVDHKKIGIMYGYAAFTFFIIGGVEALLLRIQLASANSEFLTAGAYNALFTMHGTTMIFLFVMPVGAAFMNYLLPLLIGARDVAFPRLNALSWWIFFFGGIFLYSTFIFGTSLRGAGRAPSTSWQHRPTGAGSATNPTPGPSTRPAPLWTTGHWGSKSSAWPL